MKTKLQKAKLQKAETKINVSLFVPPQMIEFIRSVARDRAFKANKQITAQDLIREVLDSTYPWRLKDDMDRDIEISKR